MKLTTLRAVSAAASKAGLGRMENNHLPQGLTVKSLKHHYSLYPLFGALGFAVCLVIGFSTRMIFKASDISWKKEAAPYNYYSDKQYKFISPRNIKYEQSAETKEAQKLLKQE